MAREIPERRELEKRLQLPRACPSISGAVRQSVSITIESGSVVVFSAFLQAKFKDH